MPTQSTWYFCLRIDELKLRIETPLILAIRPKSPEKKGREIKIFSKK